MHPGKFHTPGGNKQPVEGPKGLNLTGAVRNALSPGTARPDKVTKNFPLPDDIFLPRKIDNNGLLCYNS